LFAGARPLKRWRYVAIFSEQIMACAAQIQLGPLHQSFWAVLWRAESEVRQRTRMLRPGRSVQLGPGRVRVSDDGVLLDVSLEESDGIQALCPHGRGQVWTRKQAGVRAHGTLTLSGGRPREVDALAVIDDTAGYHARLTEWWWSAGVGAGPDGTALAWNLVEGVNDPPSGSERALWISGVPRETARVSFARDLSAIYGEDGSKLAFEAEAQRSRRENLLVLSSDYRAPFGTFSGTLPGGVELAHGLGVVEHHRAKW
jgi:Protein of unknown function (DUF2804)